MGIKLEYKGVDMDETGIIKSIDENIFHSRVKDSKIKTQDLIGKTIVAVNKKYFRPTEVETLLGDPAKAKEKLGWVPKISFKEMVQEMMESDLTLIKKNECSK